MSASRRDFIEQFGAAAMLGALPLSALSAEQSEHAAPQQGTAWDMSWTAKLDGIPNKALFDCAEIESGNGVARAGIWESQYQSALGAKPEQIKTVLILRHKAVALTLTQPMWDRFEIGKKQNVLDDNDQPTTRNPVIADSGQGQLQRFISRGGIVLACNLALQRYVRLVRDADSVTMPEAQQRVAAALVPGVILQPSGVFAAVRAGQAGCVYVAAS